MEIFSGRFYIGVVEDNNDPKRMGRCRIRVPYTYDVVPLEQLPWSSPYIEPNGKSFQIPAIGKLVNIAFYNGNIYTPYYVYTDRYNINLQDKLESITEDEYKNFVALLFDHRTRVYAEKEGFTIDYLVNKVTINKSSINLELKNNDSKVNLGSASADQAAVLGDHFIMDWFLEFMKILVKPTTLLGNYGAPIQKPELDAHIQKFIANPKQFISSNVFIVDNNKVDKLERDSITSEVEHDDTMFMTPGEAIDGGGANVEKTEIISTEAQNNMTTNQTDTKTELKESVPSVSVSDELSKTKLTDLGINTTGIPATMDVSELTMKDMINLSETDLATFDLDTITDKNLNLKILIALGFSALAIAGLTILIINKIKVINAEVKKKNKEANSKITVDETSYNDIDKYTKKRRDTRRRVSNSGYSVDQRDRSDILNSDKAVSTKKRTILYKNNPNYGKYYNGL